MIIPHLSPGAGTANGAFQNNGGSVLFEFAGAAIVINRIYPGHG